MRKVLIEAFAPLLLLCAFVMSMGNAYRYIHSGASYSFNGSLMMDSTYRAGFPIAFVWEVLANPAVQTALLSGVAWLVSRIAKSNQDVDRWIRIGQIAYSVIDDFRENGLASRETWEKNIPVILKTILDEVTAHPAIRNLSEKEVERLKGLTVQYIRRKNGLIDKPMVP